MQVICTSLQTDNCADTSSLKFFYGQMLFLPPNQQHQSIEGRLRHKNLSMANLAPHNCNKHEHNYTKWPLSILHELLTFQRLFQLPSQATDVSYFLTLGVSKWNVRSCYRFQDNNTATFWSLSSVFTVGKASLCSITFSYIPSWLANSVGGYYC